MMRMLFAALAALFLGNAHTAHADERIDPVDMALVLAIDASGSIKPQNWLLQLEGYATAFRSADLLGAIRGGERGAIAVTLVQWSSMAEQHQSVPWTRVKDRATAEALAANILETGRRFQSGTAISGAIAKSARIIAEKKFDAYRCVIDISGDGKDDTKEDILAHHRAAALAQGCTINALPIIDTERDVPEHYQEKVIGGPRAFMVVADSYRDFAQAILRKLVLEIASR